jgi:hypothetical protein
MGGFFRQPAPQQAIPQDLQGFRQGATGQGSNWLTQLSNIGGGKSTGQASDLQRLGGNYLQQYLQSNPEQQALDYALPSILQQLSGSVTDQIQPLRDISTRNLNDSLAQMSQGVPNRMSSAALWQEGATRQRSAQDFNLLAQQAMEQARSRQLQAGQTLGMLSGQAGMGGYNRAMGVSDLAGRQQGQQMQALLALLQPMLGAAYGGPMTQGTSGFQNLLSLAQTVSSFIPFGGSRSGDPAAGTTTPTSAGPPIGSNQNYWQNYTPPSSVDWTQLYRGL